MDMFTVIDKYCKEFKCSITSTYGKYGIKSKSNKNLTQSYPANIVWQADNSDKNGWNLQTSYTKLDLHNSNAHTKFGENPLTFAEVIVWKQKCWQMAGR